MTRPQAMDDRALVLAIAAGDDRAAGELFRRHRHSMHACALSVLRDAHDADDAVQMAMARAMAAIPRDRPRRLRPWLLAIARNEALMLLRARVPREALSAELEDRHQSVEGAFALREEVAGLVVDLRDLPDRQRSALVLRHLYELSYGEIGELLGVRAATARQAVLQARRSLLTRAQARDQDCGDIRLLLAGDGRARRAVSVRAHLQTCAACRAAAPAGLLARIRSLLPLPEPIVPPLLLRLLGGPGTSLRTGGAAAACVCTLAIGLGIVNELRRGPERPPAAGAAPAAVAPPDRGDRLRVAARRARPQARRVVSGVAASPPAAPPRVAPPAAPAPAPAPSRKPQAQPPAADPSPLLKPAGGEERTPHVTVEVLDDTSVTVWGYDLNNLPVVGPLPVEPPVDPEPLLP